MSFVELVAAAILLLSPDMAHEARQLTILPTDGPHAGYVVLDQPHKVWVNPEAAYNPEAVRRVLAHEITHLRDARSGRLTDKTCGEEHAQAEYRAMLAEGRPYGPGLLDWLRLRDFRPCAKESV